MSSTALSLSLSIAVLASVTLIRTLVGFQPHSGQDNYHGKHDAYGGDYEAQRHWMELTLHVPVGDWYWYDLDYWGLDYPPLTAYVSWLCGLGSSWLVGPETVALLDSRGYEDPTHKAYMRATVVLLDLLVYVAAVWTIARAMHVDNDKFLWTVTMALMQPALVLVDHGHFQYNSVSLGLSLWACYFMTQTKFSSCVVGSIFFCLALNFKQMCLYHAPAIFCYLLGRCSREPKSFLVRFLTLGATVICTFALLWWPFLAFGPSDRPTTVAERILQVLRRLFPFERGLFEGKVANLWCALSVKPFSIRSRLSTDVQPLVALAGTFLLMIPACLKLFLIGRSSTRRPNVEYDRRLLLWGMTNTSLAFFLASFQVHEKSILLALAPLSVLLWDDFAFVQWFSVAAAWTLWPLLCVDRLQVAYVCILVMFVSFTWLCLERDEFFQTSLKERQAKRCAVVSKVILSLFVLAMLALHVLEVLVPKPASLPDLFPVLWSIVGCSMFCFSWLATCWHLYVPTSREGKAKPKSS